MNCTQCDKQLSWRVESVKSVNCTRCDKQLSWRVESVKSVNCTRCDKQLSWRAESGNEAILSVHVLDYQGQSKLRKC